MDPSELPGGIPSRISGLLFALLRHLLALTELAAEETRLLIRQSVRTILLLAAMIITLVISYLALLAMVISLLIAHQGWGWSTAFGAVALFHFLLAGVILLFLRIRTGLHPYEATAAELRRDLDYLGTYSGKSSHTAP